MNQIALKYLVFIVFFLCKIPLKAQNPPAEFNLKFSNLAESWDEGIPLGNGILGALVWQKQGKLIGQTYGICAQ